MNFLHSLKMLILFAFTCQIFLTNASESEKMDTITKEDTNLMKNEALKTNLKEVESLDIIPVIPDCEICNETFPIVMKLPCKHDLCALCVDKKIKINKNKFCEKCKEALPIYSKDYAGKITVYSLPKEFKLSILDKLKHFFPLICSLGEMNLVKEWYEREELEIDVNQEGFIGCDIVKINDKRKNFVSPLWISCQNGHLKVVKYLVKNGAKVNAVNYDEVSPLFIATKNGHLNIVKFLIKHDGNVEQTDNNGISPLLVSIENEDFEMIKFLFKNKAYVDVATNTGLTPLMFVSQKESLKMFEIAKILLHHGATVDQIDDDNVTAFWYAIEYSQEPTAKLLLQNGANVNHAALELGISAFWNRASVGDTRLVKFLLDHGANPEQENLHGVTPFWAACFSGKLHIVKYLISKNVDIDKPDKEGLTPIWVSCFNFEYIIVSLLIESGANVNCYDGDKRLSPLLMATKAGRFSIVKKLLEYGAHINHVQKNKHSAVTLAMKEGYTNIAEYLIEHGADVEYAKRYFKDREQFETIKNIDFVLKDVETKKMLNGFKDAQKIFKL